MNLHDVYIFVKVVQRGSFAAAARELGISFPAVSRHVSRLEADLGVQLLRRTTRRLALSEVGQKYYERASAAIAELIAARGEAMSTNADLKGPLRVKARIGVGQHLIGPAISAFVKQYPEMRIELTIGSTSVEPPLTSEFDVVIVDQVSEKAAGVEYRHLVDVNYVVCASPKYLKSAGWPQNPRDLINHNCLIHEVRPGADEWRFREKGKDVRVSVNGSIRSNDGTAIVDALLGGAGIAHLPDYAVAEAIRRKQLTVLFINLATRRREVFAAFAKAVHQPARLLAFLDFLESFAKKWTQIEARPIKVKDDVAHQPRSAARSRRSSAARGLPKVG